MTSENKKINGFENYSEQYLSNIVIRYINRILEDNFVSPEEFSLIDIRFHGSRVRGNNRQDSDLDAVVQYSGSMREDSAFNMLNEDKLVIDGIEVDINPIQEDIDDYMKRSAEYDKEVLANLKTENLTEATRNQLVAKSRSTDEYKNKKYGKNRFERKKYSKIATQVKSYNQIDMNDLFKRDILNVKIPVTGETDEYTVSVQMEGVVAEIAKNIKSNNNKLEFRTVMQALTKIFNSSNIKVSCTCPDYLYNYKHWLIISNDATEDSTQDPGPGKTGKNPQGKGCKHILLCLANIDWLMKVASVINNYIHYSEEHMSDAFLKVIFPKLYGIPAEDMVNKDLVDDESYLDSSKGLIDAINEYGKNRGKYQKGSNKNPVTGTGGRTKKQEPTEEPVENSEEQTEETE